MKIKIDLPERLEFLSRCALFKDVSPEAIEKLAPKFESRGAVAGEVLVQEGEVGDEMFFLVEGKVKVTRSLTLLTRRGFADREKSFNYLDAGTGSNFGEMALVGDMPRTATVSAEEECRLLVLDREAFEELCAQDAELGYLVMRRICQQLCVLLQKSNDDVLKLATALSLALTPV